MKRTGGEIPLSLSVAALLAVSCGVAGTTGGAEGRQTYHRPAASVGAGKIEGTGSPASKGNSTESQANKSTPLPEVSPTLAPKELPKSFCDDEANKDLTQPLSSGEIVTLHATPDHPSVAVFNDTNEVMQDGQAVWGDPNYEVAIRPTDSKEAPWRVFNYHDKKSTVIVTFADLDVNTIGRRAGWSLQCMANADRAASEGESRLNDARNHTPSNVLGLRVLPGGQYYQPIDLTGPYTGPEQDYRKFDDPSTLTLKF